MTIGDVFSVVAAIFGIFVTSWAAVVTMALLFPNATARAREAIHEPRRALGRGLLILLTLGIGGVILLIAPLPLMKLGGWAVILMLLGISSVGTSGIALEAGRRIQSMDPSMAAYPAFVRGAAYVVGATILPLLGWLLLAPLLLIASLGAGWKAVVTAPSAAVEA